MPKGGEASCDPITEDTGGFNTFEDNTGAVSSATGCPFSCNTGFTKNGVRRTCRFPSSGKYADVSRPMSRTVTPYRVVAGHPTQELYPPLMVVNLPVREVPLKMHKVEPVILPMRDFGMIMEQKQPVPTPFPTDNVGLLPQGD